MWQSIKLFVGLNRYWRDYMAKQPTVAQLHRKLQPIFNRWIRLRDTMSVGNWVGGYAFMGYKRLGRCISCGSMKAFDELQAGHFVPEHKAVHRYNPKNVNAQCVRCNLYLKGNPFGYMLGLRDKIGARAVWFILKTKDDKAVYTVEQLQGMIEHYKNKVKELEG